MVFTVLVIVVVMQSINLHSSKQRGIRMQTEVLAELNLTRLNVLEHENTRNEKKNLCTFLCSNLQIVYANVSLVSYGPLGALRQTPAPAKFPRSHPQQSAAIRSDPRRSAAIRGDPRRSAAIRGSPQRSAASEPPFGFRQGCAWGKGCVLAPVSCIRSDPQRSAGIRGNPRGSAGIRADPQGSAAICSGPN